MKDGEQSKRQPSQGGLLLPAWGRLLVCLWLKAESLGGSKYVHPVLFACKILGGLATLALRSRDTLLCGAPACEGFKKKHCDKGEEDRIGGN